MTKHFECGICKRKFKTRQEAKECDHIRTVETRGDPIVRMKD